MGNGTIYILPENFLKYYGISLQIKACQALVVVGDYKLSENLSAVVLSVKLQM